MEKQYAGKWRFKIGIERHLYNGTEEAFVPKICAKSFDQSYCGKNGMSYKRGSTSLEI